MNMSQDDIILSLQNENRDLLNMVNALRDALEKERHSIEDRVQKALAAANNEISHHKATINALRDELEKSKIAHEEKLAKAVKQEYDEKEQLRQTIVALRECMETRNAR